jgi:Na+/H+ antiporter NhaD/arsenite permease-like protein
LTFAVIAFAAALALIASERIDRTKVALLGAVLVLLTQTIDQEAAVEAIDWNTLGLLAGMMLMVKITEPTGVYTWLAIKAGQRSRGRPFAVMVSLAVTTAVLSAFLDNLTTVLLVVPITFLLADALDIDAMPLVIVEILVSNIGGTATLIGDPPNILIAGATDLSFMAFIVNLAPVAVFTFAVVTAGLYLVFRGRLQATPEARKRVMELNPGESIEDMAELKRTIPILVGTILVFFAHKALHLEPATVAMAGATIMLLVSRQPLERSLASIEWPTLFFFIGLFVLVGALEHTGAIEEVAQAIASVTDGDRTAELLGIAWASAVGSAVVDNIPFTAAMIPVVESLQGGGDDDAYWWALSLGACFGGQRDARGRRRKRRRRGAGRSRRPADLVHVLPADRCGDHLRVDDHRHRLHGAPVPLAPPAGPEQDQRSDRPADEGAREDADLGDVDRLLGLIGELSDEERHGEADPADRGDAPHLRPADRFGKRPPAQPQPEERGPGDAEQLAEHEARHDGPRQATSGSVAEHAAPEVDPGVREREERDDGKGGEGVQPVLERLQHRRPAIGRAGVRSPSATPAMVAWTPDSCMASHTPSPATA